MDVFRRCVFPSRLKGNGGSQNSNISPFLSFTLFIACFSEYAMTINQADKFDLFSTTCVSKLVELLSFFLEFCYKAGNFEELNEFLSKKIDFIKGSVVFSV